MIRKHVQEGRGKTAAPSSCKYKLTLEYDGTGFGVFSEHHDQCFGGAVAGNVGYLVFRIEDDDAFFIEAQSRGGFSGEVGGEAEFQGDHIDVGEGFPIDPGLGSIHEKVAIVTVSSV